MDWACKHMVEGTTSQTDASAREPIETAGPNAYSDANFDEDFEITFEVSIREN